MSSLILEAGLREAAALSQGKEHLRSERGENAVEISQFHAVMLSL